MLSRRAILTGVALAGAGAIVSRLLWRATLPDPQPLKIPVLIDARKQAQSVALKVQAGHTAFFPGRESATLGYNGSYLGPVIRVHRGDDVEMSVANALGQDTTVHWHGLLIPGEVDGGPHQLIRPGDTWRPVLAVRQPAATLFYHSHVHGRTAKQVYLGLAGVLLVTDEAEQALGLPSEYGVDDLPLVLQDRQFEDGRLIIPQGMMALMMGRRGDIFLVNGTLNPVARVPRRLVRLRLVNGANARTFHLAFSDDRAFHWIASEGGLLEHSVELREMMLAPGERAEILVDFSDGRPVALETGPDPNLPTMMGATARLRNLFSSLTGDGRDHILRFEPQGTARARIDVPGRLVAVERLDASRAVRRRRFVLNMGMGMGGMMGGGRAGGMAIDGHVFEMDRIDERVRLGDVEIWEASGEMMAHPFHIHGVHFEVLRRDGKTPGVRDQGLRDTVLVQEPVELLVRFAQPAARAPFMYHCHILEHEDGGMMGQFTVS